MRRAKAVEEQRQQLMSGTVDGEPLQANGAEIGWSLISAIVAVVAVGLAAGALGTALSGIAYSPATPADWPGTPPTKVQAALDAIAGYALDVQTPVPRPLLAKLEDWVSVKDYGANCDGITDDTAAISRAIASGLPLLFPAGVCLVSNLVRSGYSFWRGQGAKTILKALDSGDARYLVADGSWLTNSATADLPFLIEDMVFDASGFKSYGFVWRSTQGSTFTGVSFYNATDTNLLISPLSSNGTTTSLNNGKILYCSFGQTDDAVSLSVFSQYSVRTVDKGASDFFIVGNFFGGSTKLPFETFNLYLSASSGFVVQNNHFYGSCGRNNDSTCGSIYLAGSDYATVVAGNIIEDSVTIVNGTGLNSYGTLFGPANMMMGGQLFCLFGPQQNLIISSGNHYAAGSIFKTATIQHGYNSSDRVVLSQGDYFELANSFTWTVGNTQGVFTCTDSYTGNFGSPRFLTGSGPAGTNFGVTSLYLDTPLFPAGFVAGISSFTDKITGTSATFSASIRSIHTLGTSSGTPTVTPGAGAGTSPTLSIATGSTDEGGEIVLFTGGSPVIGDVATITFSTSFPSYAWTALTPGNPVAENSTVYVSSSINTQFVITTATIPLIGSGTLYRWIWNTKGS